MKKIISLLAVVAMMASASFTVSAKIADGADPKATITITDLGLDAESGYNTYQVNIDLTDLGALSYTSVKVGPTTKYQGDKITKVEYDLKGQDIWYLEDVTGNLGNGFTYTGQSTDYDGIHVLYSDVGLATNYPLVASTDSCQNAITFSFMAIEGTTVTFENGSIGYGSYKNGSPDGIVQNLPITANQTTFVLGEEEVDEPAELALETTLVGKYDYGYIWNAAISLDEDNTPVKSFTAEFFAGGESSGVRSISNIEALTSKFAGEGSTSFNVGLKTTKTLDSANFVVTDEKNATDSADAPVK